MRRLTDRVLLAQSPPTKTVSSTQAPIGHQQAAARPSFLFPQHETGRTNAQSARKASSISQSSQGMSGCTQERNLSNVTHVTRPSVSRHTCSTTSGLIAASGRSNAQFVKRVSSIAPILCATCMCTLVSTYSNVTYANCTSKSHQSSFITPAIHRAPGHSAALHVGRVSNGRQIYDSTSGHTRRSVPSTVTSVR